MPKGRPAIGHQGELVETEHADAKKIKTLALEYQEANEAFKGAAKERQEVADKLVEAMAETKKNEFVFADMTVSVEVAKKKIKIKKPKVDDKD